MSVRSIRGRSVTAAAVAILLAVAVLGVGVDLLVARNLRRSLDDSLRRRAVAVAQLSAAAPSLLTAPGSLELPLAGADASVEVLDRRGRLVARSLALGGRVLPAAQLVRDTIATGRPRFATAPQAGERLRLYVAPLAESGGPAGGGAVVVAASTRVLDETVAALHAGVVLSALAAALLGAGAVAVLLARALRPLTRLAGAAHEIERTADPSRRLPATGVEDEVGGLVATLNAMLASLERSREAERRFLADASHELRTPLTALRGNVAYLASHGATGELVAELERDADRLARLAEDLIAVSREEAAGAPVQEVRLDEVVAAVTDGEEGIEVAAQPLLVVGDRPALERAVANLLQNARRHGPADGIVTVTVVSDGGRALLSVSDEGPGLDAASAELAFERFWRGRHDEAGSGLGLAIVRATAERHGGRVFAAGSRFTIELPLLRDFSRPAATPSQEPSEEGAP